MLNQFNYHHGEVEIVLPASNYFSIVPEFNFYPSSYSQKPEETISEEITAHILKPKQVDATEERINQLQLPKGFTITKF